MNRKTLQALSILSAIVVGTTAFVTPSQARTVLASLGRPVEPEDYACFRIGGSSVVNTCSTVKVWELALVIDSPGTFTAKTYVWPPNPSTPISCLAFATNESNNAAWLSPVASRNTPGSLFMTVTVPAGGGLVTNCHLPLNGIMATVSW